MNQRPNSSWPTATDTPEVLKAYGEAHGLDPYNWAFLTAPPGEPEDTTRKLADAYNQRFDPLADGAADARGGDACH